MLNNPDDYRVYIGMANVRTQHPATVLGHNAGAVVNVLAYAANRRDFCAQAEQALYHLGMNLMEMEEVEVFDFQRNKSIRKPTLLAKARHVLDTQQVMFDTFYAYAQAGDDY
ncbi:MAG: hypothetical protein MUC97_10100 [Bernardetiaceae bacterium]|jgi:hypothetical protein|nr:hypothetical protein [Bernardetiaceae bacterium]